MGGWPTKARVGFREKIAGKEIAKVTLDPERALLVREALVLLLVGQRNSQRLMGLSSSSRHHARERLHWAAGTEGGAMRRRGTRPVVLATTLLLLGGLAGVELEHWTPEAAAAGLDHGGSEAAGAGSIRLADASIIVETNATDGDAGLQVFLDGEEWREMTLTAPDGRRMLVVQNTGSLKTWGLTELFSESSEPPFDVAPFREFKKRFPEGKYRFRGTTIDGARLVGTATLTHDIPKGPVITSPADGESVPHGDVLASWEPVTRPSGIEIVGYRAIVSDETSPRGFDLELELGRSQTSIPLPSGFFRAGNEYKLEVQAIEQSGNQTLTEITFSVT